MTRPQAFVTAYPPRLRTYANTILNPVIPTQTAATPLTRTTKRGTTIINYAEDGYGDDFDEDDEDAAGGGGGSRRRLTGLRSVRREEAIKEREKESLADRLNKELKAPVQIQGIWREWMGKSLYAK